MKDDFGTFLSKAIDDCLGSSAYSMERDRPYDGQPHTSAGERGKTKVEGVTFRDVSDCIILGLLESTGEPLKENPVENDVYSVDWNDIDFMAVVKNSLIRIEKLMNIYPNISKLTCENWPEGIIDDDVPNPLNPDQEREVE